MNRWLKEDLWRHIVAGIAVLFALFPLYLVVISSFNSTGSLQITSFVPREISWANYQMLFSSPTIPPRSSIPCIGNAQSTRLCFIWYWLRTEAVI